MNTFKNVSLLMFDAKDGAVINERRENLFRVGDGMEKRAITIVVSKDMEESEEIRAKNLIHFIERLASLNGR